MAKGLSNFTEKKGLESRVLIASPIRQKPLILTQFLQSLRELEHGDLRVDYFFIDDNDNPQSQTLLNEFSRKGSIKHIERTDEEKVMFKCDENTHYWNNDAIYRVTKSKNRQIKFALENDYDYIFFIDSDLVLHSKTLTHLYSLNLDIVSEIFWTSWQPNSLPLPNVWQYDNYAFAIREGEDEKELRKKVMQWLEQLKIPGVYKVGGLGACTLIKRRVLEKGVDFSRIYNISFPGEDRHFCIRAVANGFELYVDTHYPCYHIYRESDLAGVEKWKERNKIWDKRVTKSERNKLCLAMMMKNEANRYLRVVLNRVKSFIDYAVILDDNSTDDTIEVCKEILAGVPLTILDNKENTNNEVVLRKKLWNTAVSIGDWILILDADELFEPKIENEISKLINQTYCDVWAFRLYDMWDEKHYREDKYWSAHLIYRPFLVRYQPNFEYKWRDTPVHCGRFPENITLLPTYASDIRVKHLGYMKKEDRIKKYLWYMEKDPEGKYGIMAQYQSILDENPNLKLWKE